MSGAGKKSKAVDRAQRFDRVWGVQLRRRRVKCGLSIAEAAANSGVSVAVIERSETAPSRVSIDTLIMIFEAYGLKLSQALRPSRKPRD